MKRPLLPFILFFVSLMPIKGLYAQTSPVGSNIIVNAGATPMSMVTSLVDPTIFISNVTSSYAAKACGSFTNNGSNVGMTSGVLLTTGLAVTYTTKVGVVNVINTGSEGPNADPCNTGGAKASTSNGGGTTDTDLKKLAGTTINDVCKIEFDMVVPTDTVQLQYVFGSEEYDYYAPGGGAGSSFNDVFGFFISGPGITVPAGYTGLNIATIPGTAINVGINTVNRSTNPSYYVDNCTSPTAASLQYNAMTKLLTAKVKVIAGQTYHVKLGIADATDGAYDSGVFLKANSIKPVAVPVELMEFNAHQDKSINKITWKTAQEKNCDRFEVLRRNDEGQFQVIGTVKGAGTSSLPRLYEFTDSKPLAGNNYYFLRQVDLNGKANLSKVVSLQNLQNIAIKDIYPNPVLDQFSMNIEFPAEKSEASLQIIDLTGKTIFTRNIDLSSGSNQIQMETSFLNPGTYFVRVQTSDFISPVYRIIK